MKNGVKWYLVEPVMCLTPGLYNIKLNILDVLYLRKGDECQPLAGIFLKHIIYI